MQPAGREIFWQIGEIRVFYGLALLAVLVFLLGLFGRVRFIRRGAPVRFAGGVREKGWAATLWEVVTHRSSRENPRARGWHLLVFSGWWMLTAVTLWVMMADRVWPELFVGAGYRCVSFSVPAWPLFRFRKGCLPGGVRRERLSSFR